MSRISTHCELRYTVMAQSSFYFAVLAARGPRQQVIEERLIVTPELSTTRVPFGLPVTTLCAWSPNPTPSSGRQQSSNRPAWMPLRSSAAVDGESISTISVGRSSYSRFAALPQATMTSG